MAWRQRGDKPFPGPMRFMVHGHIYAALGGDELKVSSYQQRDSHCKDKLVSRLQNHNGNSYTWKDSLYIETGPDLHVDVDNVPTDLL